MVLGLERSYLCMYVDIREVLPVQVCWDYKGRTCACMLILERSYLCRCLGIRKVVPVHYVDIREVVPVQVCWD